MPAKKTTKKAAAKTSKKSSGEVSPVLSGAAMLFGGGAVILLGLMQDRDNIQLLLVGFGAALLVLGGTLLGMAARQTRR